MAYHFEILTLFPRMVHGYAGESILGKAREKGLFELTVTDIRDFADGKHRVTDDAPYGGGAGMVMKVEPLVRAIEAAKQRQPTAEVLLMSPKGQRFHQGMAKQLASKPGLILVCGRYEGVDERVLKYVDQEISVGDYVLTGGELVALILLDAVARLVPSVLGNDASSTSETFEDNLLEYPQYTRPPEFRDAAIPEVLLSGDHARIERWRRWKALKLTQTLRPDLFAARRLTKEEQKLLLLNEEQI